MIGQAIIGHAENARWLEDNRDDDMRKSSGVRLTESTIR